MQTNNIQQQKNDSHASHATFVYCPNCKQDLCKQEIRDNECFSCGERLFNPAIGNPVQTGNANEYDTEIDDETMD